MELSHRQLRRELRARCRELCDCHQRAEVSGRIGWLGLRKREHGQPVTLIGNRDSKLCFAPPERMQ